MSSKGYQTDASQFPGKDPVGKPMGSREEGEMTPDWKHPMTKDVYKAGLNDGRKSLESEIAKLRAALEEIVRNGDQGIHVPGPYEIAKAALAKEGK